MTCFETKQLRAFVGVAQSRSFTIAAGSLAISRPALSLQLAKLERQLGFALFERTTRAVTLTPEGADLLPFAERTLAEHELLRAEVRKLGKGRGTVMVGTALHTSRWSLRNRLLDEFPRAHKTVELQVETGHQRNLLPALEGGRLDAVLFGGAGTTREDYDARQATGRTSEGLYPADLTRVVLERRGVELLVPAEHPLASEPVIRPAMLKGVAVAVPHPRACPPIYGAFARLVEEIGGQLQFVPDHNAYSLDQFCRRSRTVTLTPGQFLDEPQLGDILSRPVAGFEPLCELVLLSRPGDRSHALRALAGFARSLSASGERGLKAAG